MKKLVAIVLAVCFVGMVSPAFAKGKKGAAKKEKTENALAKFDTNNNGLLEADEVTAAQKDYTDNKTEALKKYDTNNDGKIDDTEAAAIKTDFTNGGKKHHKKK